MMGSGVRVPASALTARCRSTAIACCARLHAADLDADAIRVEDEDFVVVREVSVLLRWVVDIRADGKAPLVRVIYLSSGVHVECDVLDSDVVVAVLAAVCWPEPE